MNPEPRESLIQYQAPIEVLNKEESVSEKKKKEYLYDSRLSIDCKK